jgi:superfamily II DNA/RNA helicase
MDSSERHRQIQVGPSPPELYVQRVGRSGRGGNKGKGILLP